MSKSLEILHVSRDNNNNKEFSCNILRWSRERKEWQSENIPLLNRSGLLKVLGSGCNEFDLNYVRYKEGPNQGTSRNVFHCFCDTLFNIKDPKCGGAPQLVGIYKKHKSFAIKFGIIKNEKRYLFGAEVDELTNFDRIVWRNDLFEICDGSSTKRDETAMPQPNILRQPH